jgi:hypothetical protein
MGGRSGGKEKSERGFWLVSIFNLVPCTDTLVQAPMCRGYCGSVLPHIGPCFVPANGLLAYSPNGGAVGDARELI